MSDTLSTVDNLLNRSVSNRVVRILAVAIVLIAGIYGLRTIVNSSDTAHDQAKLITPAESPAGFARVESPIPLEFPRDHGPHPDYQTEWWYYTGNLETPNSRHFGYELTFFRRALVPPAARANRASDWGTDQIYMAHFAISDVQGGKFIPFERLSRGAAGLAGAQGDPYTVWLNDWRVRQTGKDSYQVIAQQGGIRIDLNFRDLKGPVLQGDRGYSQKGPELENASMYYSLTRLETTGTVGVDAQDFAVTGLSWMDHEFSTSALAANQVGWDWFALQLDDGSELMLIHFRNADGSIGPYSGGTLVRADGTTQMLKRDDFGIVNGKTWTSPHSGATYPAEWIVTIPPLDLTLRIQPYLADQELNVSFVYWEGAVSIEGERSGHLVHGSGYIELTGYAASLAGQF